MSRAIFGTAALCGFMAMVAYSAPAREAPANARSNDAPVSYRASTIEGLPVRNAAGEDIGKIKDLVIDVRTGKVMYAALDFGGFIGVGDRLFAVPWHAFQVRTADGKDELQLNVAKDRLKQAPGFDKNHWPNMANPDWSKDFDVFYGPEKTARR